MMTSIATPYDQNPARIAFVTKNIRKRERSAVLQTIGALASLQLAIFFVWNALI